jgi:hypothetical protein
MLPIPTPATEVTNMADWLEARALLAADRNSSRSDLRRLLVQSGIASDAPNIDDEVMASDAFSELEDRAKSCGSAYPFSVEGSVVQAPDSIDSFWPYIFCLLLSLQGANRSHPGKRPTEMFEEIAEVTAGSYVSGRAVKFGFPRRILPPGFVEALDRICKEMGEGVGAKKRPATKHAKDARLDILAWRPFLDGRPAQLLLFGQCAAGANWHNKLTDLQPRSFIDIYLKEAPAVDPVKAFFTPFRIKSIAWYETAKYGGIIFDRCRIAQFATKYSPPAGVLEWINRTLRVHNR